MQCQTGAPGAAKRDALPFIDHLFADTLLGPYQTERHRLAAERPSGEVDDRKMRFGSAVILRAAGDDAESGQGLWPDLL